MIDILLQILLWSAVIGLFLVGIVGAVIPVLPGTPFILAGIFIYAWSTGFEIVTWPWLITFTGLTLISVGLDHLLSVMAPRGAKASWWAVVGAAVGLVAGCFFGLPGILLGPLVGATLFEWLYCRQLSHSLGAGISTFIGFMVATALKLAIAITMIGIFIFLLF